MQNERISFDAMPEMLAAIAQKLESIETKVDHLTIPPNKDEKDEWFNLKGLCDYLPSHPAEQTVYGWTSTHFIPFIRKARALPSVSQRLTNGYNKAIEKVRKISCWRPVNSLTGKRTNSRMP